MAEEIEIDAKAFFKRTSAVLARWKVRRLCSGSEKHGCAAADVFHAAFHSGGGW
jgi:hypothetical protein